MKTPDAFACGELPACAAFSLQRDRREAAECLAGGVDHDPHRFESGDTQKRLAIRLAENDSPGSDLAKELDAELPA